jgi:hypothetical protein
MIILLAYPSVLQSVKVLGITQLEDQLADAQAILDHIIVTSPNPKPLENMDLLRDMWYGYEWLLMLAGIAAYDELRLRGYPPPSEAKQDLIDAIRLGNSQRHIVCSPEDVNPPWLGTRKLHLSHRAELIRCDSRHARTWPNINPDLPVYWPWMDLKVLSRRTPSERTVQDEINILTNEEMSKKWVRLA